MKRAKWDFADNTAIYCHRNIRMLIIKQAKAYVCWMNLVDYNDSHKMMRIKRSARDTSETPESDYAVYFYAK